MEKSFKGTLWTSSLSARMIFGCEIILVVVASVVHDAWTSTRCYPKLPLLDRRVCDLRVLAQSLRTDCRLFIDAVVEAIGSGQIG
jgi:hypothetical protein